MGVFWIALSVMVASVLVVNLGLGEAIAKVSDKVLQCPTCLTFWGTLGALLYNGADVVLAVVLSILMAYVSNYFGILLTVLNRLYEKLWERSNAKK